LYEYECFLCRHRFERIQKVAADSISECPACGGAVRRLLGTPALQFKGSGWYVTDYGNGRTAGTTDTANADSSKAASNTDENTSSASDTATKPSADKSSSD
jgi:putative FmdB family regulatory protein